MTGWEDDRDPWLGTLLEFPRVLHSSAIFTHEVNNDSLQKAVLKALHQISISRLPIELSLSDHQGYYHGAIAFRLGIGNGEAFDVFDQKEEERLLKRIENRGAFTALDLSFTASYSIRDQDRRHPVRADRFLARLIFRLDRLEIYVHHLRGIRRVRAEEIIELLVEHVNGELRRDGHSILAKDDSRKENRTIVKNT